jgi:hypothetical protein
MGPNPTEFQEVEVDTSEALPFGKTKLADGRVIDTLRRGFGYRKATLTNGQSARLDMKGKVYEVMSNGSIKGLTPKLKKADKRALKRQKTAQRREAGYGKP